MEERGRCTVIWSLQRGQYTTSFSVIFIAIRLT
jgi:hypothetical protein